MKSSLSLVRWPILVWVAGLNFSTYAMSRSMQFRAIFFYTSVWLVGIEYASPVDTLCQLGAFSAST